MTLTGAYWLWEKSDPDTPLEAYLTGVASLHVAGAPYDYFLRGSQRLRDINWWSDIAHANRQAHSYMARRGMPISKSSARHFAQTTGSFVPGTARYPGSAGARILRGRTARIAAKVAGRMVPGLGWALLAYDIYTVGRMITD